ncbi:nucleolysin TIAR-like [Phlebotomus papatasi]|uniref:nucleolysin TIAR-like n=1 Tax=Phlebotomus papatasi TaxID=29031 RepID=UPI002483837C|nr:nucleolysin TIAR-like [Phlebotomus papatasi]
MDESQPKTLYVGNLGNSVSEELLWSLFAQIGMVKNFKIIREPGNDPYAFIEFTNHQSASTALTAMNKRLFLDKEMKVNWATSPGNQPKADTSSHHHIFVGDLSPEIEAETLREAFAPFGEISNCRIVRDPQKLKSKGYAFVSFVKKAEAENAIQAMNGQWLGSRSIRTNWSTRKPQPPRETSKGIKGGKPSYEEVYNQTSPTNATVYCGGFAANVISEELVHKHFGQFGAIQDVRVFKDTGYAFIKFTRKEVATHAIEVTHNTDINGQPVMCFWGKENGGDTTSNAQPSNQSQPVQPQGAQYLYSYQQMGYWYQPGYPAAQMPAQYMQQVYYPYTYTSPQQGAGAYRMVQPANTMYMGVPTVQSVTATNGAAANQPQIMYTAMPQYQYRMATSPGTLYI